MQVLTFLHLSMRVITIVKIIEALLTVIQTHYRRKTGIYIPGFGSQRGRRQELFEVLTIPGFLKRLCLKTQLFRGNPTAAVSDFF